MALGGVDLLDDDGGVAGMKKQAYIPLEIGDDG